MTKILSVMAVAMMMATSALAFSLDGITNPKEAKLQTCMMSEAKKAIATGSVTSANVEKKAAEVAAICAASESMDVDPAMVKSAAQILKSLL